MITLADYYQNREVTHAGELSPELESLAIILLSRVNRLMSYFGQSRKVTSGWRPPSYNHHVPGAAKFSKHMSCQAIDLADPHGDLDEWLLEAEGTAALELCQLWHEHPAATKGWAHLQSVPPRSNKRHFYP